MTAVDQPTDSNANVDEPILVSLTGEIDMAREGQLLAILQSLDTGLSGTSVVVDLSEVTFLDSSGIRGLLRASNYLSDLGCQLRLVRPSRPVIKTFELVGLTEYLTLAVDSSEVEAPVENGGLPGTVTAPPPTRSACNTHYGS